MFIFTRKTPSGGADSRHFGRKRDKLRFPAGKIQNFAIYVLRKMEYNPL